MSKHENIQVRDMIVGGEPVEVWQVGDSVYIVPKSSAEAGNFPWRNE